MPEWTGTKLCRNIIDFASEGNDQKTLLGIIETTRIIGKT